MTNSDAKKTPKTVPCPDCQGRGVRSWATEDMTCATCGGKGTVTKGS